MLRGPVRVAVDDPRDLCRAERRVDRGRLDVDDRLGLDRGRGRGCGRRSQSAMPRRSAIGQREKTALPAPIVGHTAEALVGDVGGAQFVAVHQQRRRAGDVDDDLFRQQRRAGGVGEALAEEKVAIAARRRPTGTPDSASARSAAATRTAERLAQLIVADPLIEQVAEHVDARGGACRRRAERIERRHAAPDAPATGGGRR